MAENLGRDPGSGWDFEALCWVGFYYQPTLELARAQWATAVASQRLATQRPNPTLTVAPGYNFTREAGISPWMPTLSADFLLSGGRKRTLQERVAAADAEAVRLAVVTAAWQLRSDLRHAVIEATGAARRAVLLRSQAEAQVKLLSLLQQRFMAGSISSLELAVTRTAMLRAESAAADAEAQAATARVRVATVIGVPAAALDGIELPAVPSPTPLAAAELAAARRRALETRADVRAALAKYASTQAALELEVARRFPDIHFGPAYQYDQGQNKWSLGLTFELPVFHQNEAAIAVARAHRDEAAAQFNVVQNQVVGALDAAAAALTAASAQLQRAERLRAEMDQQRAAALQRQRAGAADQVEVESARLDALSTDAGWLEAQLAVASAAGQLEDALQIPYPNLESVLRLRVTSPQKLSAQ